MNYCLDSEYDTTSVPNHAHTGKVHHPLLPLHNEGDL